jgi:hypothetical protein
MATRKKTQEQPTQPDGLPGNSDANDGIRPEDGPAITVGDQPSGPTDPETDPSHSDMTKPGKAVQIGDQSGQPPRVATSLPTLPEGGAEVSEEELAAHRAREGIVIGDGGVMDRPPYIIRGADNPGEINSSKVDPIVGQSNVELPTGAVKIDMGSKEPTNDLHQYTARRREESEEYQRGFAAAMKLSRGEI